MSGDLHSEVGAEMASRRLSSHLVALVEHSTMIPERSHQLRTLEWLRGQTPEERKQFGTMLEGVAERAERDAPDDLLVDRILAEESDAHA